MRFSVFFYTFIIFQVASEAASSISGTRIHALSVDFRFFTGRQVGNNVGTGYSGIPATARVMLLVSSSASNRKKEAGGVCLVPEV